VKTCGKTAKMYETSAVFLMGGFGVLMIIILFEDPGQNLVIYFFLLDVK
jgi:hypothetical protein